jgi:hypothetical protein
VLALADLFEFLFAHDSLPYNLKRAGPERQTPPDDGLDERLFGCLGLLDRLSHRIVALPFRNSHRRYVTIGRGRSGQGS